MTWVPVSTVLGHLRMEETFLFYDRPLLFSALSLTDQRFLAVFVADTDDGGVWLYVPVSDARWAMVRSGGISVRGAVNNAEGIVYRVELTGDGDTAADDARPLRKSEIDSGWLPQPELRIETYTATQRPAETAAALATRAVQEHRTRLRLEMVLPDYSRTEVSLRKVGELLTLTQNVYDNFGYAIDVSDPAQRGRIPHNIATETEGVLAGTAAASFVLEIASRNSEDLLGLSLFARSTQKLMTLLDLSLDQAGLTAELQGLRVRGAKSFRNFVRGLANTGADFSIGAAGPFLEYQDRKLPMEQLRTLSSILTSLVPDPEPLEIRRRVTLLLIDTARELFGVQVVGSPDEQYEGSVAEAALPALGHATPSNEYDALILETRIIDEVVGDVKVSHELAQLTPIA